jgi:hypothetical protein
MGTELPKTADADPLLEQFFQAARRRVPSFSEKFHPCVQNRSAIQLIYHHDMSQTGEDMIL